eukprot:6566151-Pyramimonas_sp.AAC.1
MVTGGVQRRTPPAGSPPAETTPTEFVLVSRVVDTDPGAKTYRTDLPGRFWEKAEVCAPPASPPRQRPHPVLCQSLHSSEGIYTSPPPRLASTAQAAY